MPPSSHDLSELNDLLRRFVDDEDRRSSGQRALERHQQEDDRKHEDAARENRSLSDRLTKIEAYIEVRSEDLSDTKRWRLVEMGVLRPNSVPPKRHDSVSPGKIVLEVVRSKWALAALSAAIMWLLHHLPK